MKSVLLVCLGAAPALAWTKIHEAPNCEACAAFAVRSQEHRADELPPFAWAPLYADDPNVSKHQSGLCVPLTSEFLSKSTGPLYVAWSANIAKAFDVATSQCTFDRTRFFSCDGTPLLKLAQHAASDPPLVYDGAKSPSKKEVENGVETWYDITYATYASHWAPPVVAERLRELPKTSSPPNNDLDGLVADVGLVAANRQKLHERQRMCPQWLPLATFPLKWGHGDCLLLDVVAPKPLENGHKKGRQLKPVIVWIHGGFFELGDKNQQGLYDARSLAFRTKTVVVSINYRLGGLGFLAHPAMTKDKTTALNVGLRDQHAALRWVQDNIALFGGDPRKVTIFGESAGAMSVSAHLAIAEQLKTSEPGTAPLFHGAVMSSGNSAGRFFFKKASHANELGVRFLREMVFEAGKHKDKSTPACAVELQVALASAADWRAGDGLLDLDKQVFECAKLLAPHQLVSKSTWVNGFYKPGKAVPPYLEFTPVIEPPSAAVRPFKGVVNAPLLTQLPIEAHRTSTVPRVFGFNSGEGNGMYKRLNLFLGMKGDKLQEATPKMVRAWYETIFCSPVRCGILKDKCTKLFSAVMEAYIQEPLGARMGDDRKWKLITVPSKPDSPKIVDKAKQAVGGLVDFAKGAFGKSKGAGSKNGAAKPPSGSKKSKTDPKTRPKKAAAAPTMLEAATSGQRREAVSNLIRDFLFVCPSLQASNHADAGVARVYENAFSDHQKTGPQHAGELAAVFQTSLAVKAMPMPSCNAKDARSRGFGKLYAKLLAAPLDAFRTLKSWTDDNALVLGADGPFWRPKNELWEQHQCELIAKLIDLQERDYWGKSTSGQTPNRAP